MSDPESSNEIIILINKPCWEQPLAYWTELLEPVVRKTLHYAKWAQPSEVNILLTDDAEMRKLNKQYRGFDKSTNVLSFPSLEAKEVAALLNESTQQTPIILGDIALAFEAIQHESREQDKSFTQHLVHLVVHGILHLLGYDHDNDEDASKMESLEIEILSDLMIPNPYKE